MATDDDSGLGFSFWAALILLLILTRAAYAWGFFGALMVFVAILLLVAWFYDRRQIERYEES